MRSIFRMSTLPCHTLFSILKAFLAFFSRLWMSKPAPSSCLAMLPKNRRRGYGNIRQIHSDEGLTLETSVFESFTVANLAYRPCD